MQPKRNKEITMKAWLNEVVISDENWEVYSEDLDDVLYVFAKDVVTGNQLKIKIEKSPEIKPEPNEKGKPMEKLHVLWQLIKNYMPLP